MLKPVARASEDQKLRASGKPAATLQPAAPEWTEDLIIYEIATKGFTSPRGPETGSFESLKAKLPYLEELGITGIWLTGYALCDSHHFYNIWTQYAVIEPDKLDPSLGTGQEFRSLIEDAHRRGIRVILDVITHGLMEKSPVIRSHPEWFQGGSWGMNDFDWYGGHTDLDAWWVKIWTDYVTNYGVDGYRLDVAIYRPDLWERVRQNAADAGHPIIIFEEGDSAIPGVTDFTQGENVFSSEGESGNPGPKEILSQDVPGFLDRKFGKAGRYQVEVQYADDGSRVKGSTEGEGELRVHLDGQTLDKTTRRIWVGFLAMPDGIPDVQLTVENLKPRPIENIVVTDDMGGRWELRSTESGHLAVGGRDPLSLEELEGKPSLQLFVPTLAHGWPTIQLSCHDNGWEGFPLDKSAYVAQGSRVLFGYACLFTPMIPLFFSGEEFNATYRPIPWESPQLYGAQDAGKGRWLYGAMLDWEELSYPEHRAMFEDVKKMIAIRKREAEVLAVRPEREKPKLIAIPCEQDITAPAPYLRWNHASAIVVAANRNTNQDAHLKLRIPLKEIGMGGRRSYCLTELWPAAETRVCAESDLDSLACTVRRDRVEGGGLKVLKIEPSAA
jgi:glycosidase